MFFTYLKRMDWALNASLLLLATISIFVIASANPANVIHQALWFALALVAFAVCAIIDWRPLATYRWMPLMLYGFGLALLIMTFFFAPTIRGARSWLVMGPVQMQTSELIKAALIIVFSYYFAYRHVGIAQWRNIFIPFLYAAVPGVLILLQPDMGSVLIILGIWIIYLLVSGIQWRHIAIGLLVAAAFSAWGWTHALADYQRERIRGLFNPQYDPLGVNYNVIQSKIAIGSGEWLGKGWRQGTQVQLGFLPEAANDFVFAAIIEEWGAVGGIVLLGAFAVLIGRILTIGARAPTNFAKLICLGVSGLLLLHIFLNIGSAVGLTPVVGVPLPFVSYGGSNLLTSSILVGIVQSIAIRSVF